MGVGVLAQEVHHVGVLAQEVRHATALRWLSSTNNVTKVPLD